MRQSLPPRSASSGSSGQDRDPALGDRPAPALRGSPGRRAAPTRTASDPSAPSRPDRRPRPVTTSPSRARPLATQNSWNCLVSPICDPEARGATGPEWSALANGTALAVMTRRRSAGSSQSTERPGGATPRSQSGQAFPSARSPGGLTESGRRDSREGRCSDRLGAVEPVRGRGGAELADSTDGGGAGRRRSRRRVLVRAGDDAGATPGAARDARGLNGRRWVGPRSCNFVPSGITFRAALAPRPTLVDLTARCRAQGLQVTVQWRAIRSAEPLPGFPSARQMIMVIRERATLANEPLGAPEAVFAITSLPPKKASRRALAKMLRGHWRIENGLHHVRDATFDEDRSRVRTGSGPRVMASLRNLAITIHRLLGEENIASASRRCRQNYERSFERLCMPTRKTRTRAA